MLPRQNKMTFLNLFIIPALNAAFDKLIKEEEEGNIEEFCLESEWALIITEAFPEWRDEDTYRSAQYYMQELLSGRGTVSRIPVLESFQELMR